MIDIVHMITFGVLVLSAILIIAHAWRIDSAFDRALAIETLSLVLIATLLLYVPLGTDAALGLAIFSFVSTALLGYFLGQGDFPHD